jgi:hypothetical protein
MLFDIFGNSVEKFTEIKDKDPSEYLALVGNLATSGYVKAKDFIKDDGNSVKEVSKYVLPNNFKFDNNNTELNGQFIINNDNKRVFKVNKEGDVAINGRLYSTGTDLHLFNKERAGSNDHPGRALVHGVNDTLNINFNGDYKGGTTINSNLVTTGLSQHRGGASVEGRLHFRHSGANGSDDTDPYYLEKVRTAANNNHLRLTINDDANESFQIWGNSCGSAGGCGGPGRQLYNFSANGQMDVNNRLNVPNVDRIGGDWLRVNGAGNSVGQTALYGNLSINDARNNKGGLAVGSWSSPGRGNASVTGGVRIGDGGAPWGNRGLHVRNQDGRWTHFNWQGDNKNYIRGHTQIDGNVNTNGNMNVTGNIATGHRWNNGVNKNPVNVGKPDVNGNFGNGSAYVSFLDTDAEGVNKGTSIAFVPHQWGVANTERMRISANGNVGINTNNPTQRLEVNGTTKVNQLCIGDRWCINAEGDHLVFRDNKSGGDKRYAMFANNNKNL